MTGSSDNTLLVKLNLEKKLQDYDKDLDGLREVSAANSAVLERMETDIRSMQNQVQNLTISFGSLKEKALNITAMPKELGEEVDQKIQRSVDIMFVKAKDIRELCAANRQVKDTEIRASVTNMETKYSALVEMVKSDSARILDIENKINNVIYSALLALIGYIIKLLYPQLGS